MKKIKTGYFLYEEHFRNKPAPIFPWSPGEVGLSNYSEEFIKAVSNILDTQSEVKMIVWIEEDE